MVIYVPDGKDMLVCVALPMIVGARSMVMMLWQLLEYYGCDNSSPVSLMWT